MSKFSETLLTRREFTRIGVKFLLGVGCTPLVLKAFTETFYQEICSSSLKPVLKTLKNIHRVHFQVLENHVEDGKYKFCDYAIPGVWKRIEHGLN